MDISKEELDSTLEVCARGAKQGEQELRKPVLAVIASLVRLGGQPIRAAYVEVSVRNVDPVTHKDIDPGDRKIPQQTRAFWRVVARTDSRLLEVKASLLDRNERDDQVVVTCARTLPLRDAVARVSMRGITVNSEPGNEGRLMRSTLTVEVAGTTLAFPENASDTAAAERAETFVYDLLALLRARVT